MAKLDVKNLLLDALSVGIIFLLLQMAWTEIGKLFPFFTQIAGFGFTKIGLTVGFVLALAIGIPVAGELRKRIPVKWLKK